MQKNISIREALDFDDVLLLPAETSVKSSDVSTKTRLTKTIELGMPLISAARPEITESAMAIALAHMGGLGIIHDKMPLGKQVEEVRRVKRAGGAVVSNPVTISPESSVAEAIDLMTTYKFSGLPVIDQSSKKVVGIITNRDVRFFEDGAQPVSALMSKNVITVKAGIKQDEARKLMHQHRIEKLVVVDDKGQLTGLMTAEDMEKLTRYPNATRDNKGFLRVGAAVGMGRDAFDRAVAMADAGLDVVFIDVAHAHNKDVINTVSRIRQQRSTDVQIVAGNVATAEGARSLIDAGADAVKVGIGGASSSATRRIGVGIPQFAAILDVAEQCGMQGVPLIVDGGICGPADLAKAIAAGASAAVIGSLFQGADETPVHTAPQTPGHDPYHLDEAETLHRGAVAHMVNDLLAGFTSAMAYTGSKNIAAMHDNTVFVRAK
jgi:IMP dehydrogenase